MNGECTGQGPTGTVVGCRAQSVHTDKSRGQRDQVLGQREPRAQVFPVGPGS